MHTISVAQHSANNMDSTQLQPPWSSALSLTLRALKKFLDQPHFLELNHTGLSKRFSDLATYLVKGTTMPVQAIEARKMMPVALTGT